MTRYLIINLFISLLWPTLNGEYSLNALFTGFLLGFVVLAIVKRSYGRYFLHATAFLLYVLYAILQSNLKLAWLVLGTIFSPRIKLQPGIVAVPLTITDPFERTLLASVITLTPGTLSVDLGQRDGGDVLFVHTVDLKDPAAFRREIKENFENRILHLHRLQADMADTGRLLGNEERGVQ
ncbi:MAG: Na+/H+ antiporter subunit E [Chloroflexi bacterium]|nr:Na+/H+ antiporter subunit E [Chloroflexota bacterium]